MKSIKPKDSRRKRLRPSPGMWTPISLDLGRIVRNHLKESKGIDPTKRKNMIPIYVIPIFFSYLRALAIEIENQKETAGKGEYTSKLLSALETNPSNEVIMICKRFNVSSELRKSAEVLNHIRHEIIHPSPYVEDGCLLPVYLHCLAKKNLLWKPPHQNFACNILDFFCSHKLLNWGALVIADIAQTILDSDEKYKHLNKVDYNLIGELRTYGM